MPSPEPPSLDPVRRSFRRACFLRLEGKEQEAATLLREELTPLVEAWRESPEGNRETLEKLFEEEMVRTEEVWSTAELVHERLLQDLEGDLAEKLQESLREPLEAIRRDFDSLREALDRFIKNAVLFTTPAYSRPATEKPVRPAGTVRPASIRRAGENRPATAEPPRQRTPAPREGRIPFSDIAGMLDQLLDEESAGMTVRKNR